SESRFDSSTTANGSTNSVWPELDASWTMPGTFARSVARTASTGRPPRSARNDSCSASRTASERATRASSSRTRAAPDRSSARSRRSSGDAESRRSEPSSSTARSIVRVSDASDAGTGAASSRRSGATAAAWSSARLASSATSTVCATARSAAGASVPPRTAWSTPSRTSWAPASDGSAASCSSATASAVSAWRRTTSSRSLDGSSARAAPAPCSVSVRDARRSTIAGSSSAASACTCTCSSPRDAREQLAYAARRHGRMAQGARPLDLVDVPPPAPLARDVAPVDEVGEHAVRLPLGDLRTLCDLAHRQAGCLRDGEQDDRVRGEELPFPPFRHRPDCTNRRRLLVRRLHRRPVRGDPGVPELAVGNAPRRGAKQLTVGDQQLLDAPVQGNGAPPGTPQRLPEGDQRTRPASCVGAHGEVVVRDLFHPDAVDAVERRPRGVDLRLPRRIEHPEPEARLRSLHERETAIARVVVDQLEAPVAQRDQMVEQVRRVPIVERRERRTARSRRPEQHSAVRRLRGHVDDVIDVDGAHVVEMVEV